MNGIRTTKPLRAGLALLLATLTCAASGQQACGDCNGDGQLTILDALHAAQISAGLAPVPTPHCFEAFAACNVSGDLCPLGTSQIDVLDALLLAQAAAGLPVVLDCGTPLGQPPTCMILAPVGGMWSGDVTVTFDLDDPDTPSLVVEFFYSTDMGVTFQMATPAAMSPSPFDLNPTASPPGGGLTFIWDSLNDVAATPGTVVFRITVDDGTSNSMCETTFDVDNTGWMACVGAGVSILQNPGFETGDMTGWTVTAFQIDTRPHDGNFSTFAIGNNALRQSFPAVPVSQITRFRYWGMHPNENVFGVTWALYDDGTMDNIIHAPWMAWTEFDLLAQLNPAKNLQELYIWGYSGGGPGVDETVFDSVELCWFP